MALLLEKTTYMVLSATLSLEAMSWAAQFTSQSFALELTIVNLYSFMELKQLKTTTGFMTLMELMVLLELDLDLIFGKVL